MSGSALVLLCKKPQLGYGKQRLAADIGDSAALKVAELLLQASIETIHAWQGPTFIAPAQDEDLAWAGKLLANVPAISQGQGNLGERLMFIDQNLRAAGHQQVIMIGSDCPRQSASDLVRAEQALAQADFRLDPATDGGVVLMAARRPWPPLADLSWSSSQLGAELAEAIDKLGCSLSWGNAGADLDCLADLKTIAVNLAQDLRPARQALYQHLQRVMA